MCIVVEIDAETDPSRLVKKADPHVMVYGGGVKTGCLAELGELVAFESGRGYRSLHGRLDA